MTYRTVRYNHNGDDDHVDRCIDDCDVDHYIDDYDELC